MGMLEPVKHLINQSKDREDPGLFPVITSARTAMPVVLTKTENDNDSGN